MCGIVGFIGSKDAKEILYKGLEKLEYRGYDSSGIAIISHSKTHIIRSKGKLSELKKIIYDDNTEGKIGIAHTRWATHGRPSVPNAHPHKSGPITIVHNGIIENYLELKQMLGEYSRNIVSQTDTEIVAHLICKYYNEYSSTIKAIIKAASLIRGSYALVVLNEKEPDALYAAKHGSPLIVAKKGSEGFIASDIQAVAMHTKEYISLEDGDFVLLNRENLKIFNSEEKNLERNKVFVDWDIKDAEKGGYKHFMLKEIFEQPLAFVDTVENRISPEFDKILLPELEKLNPSLLKCDRLYLVACGTAYYASFVAKYFIENTIKLPVEVELASEFRYKNNFFTPNAVVVFVSQSGETADTLAALKNVKTQNIPTLSICNVKGSSIARASDAVIYTHAGLEIGVASTKAFISQMAALYLFMLYLGQKKELLTGEKIKEHIGEFVKVPSHMTTMLEKKNKYKDIASSCKNFKDIMFIGRNLSYPIALEGALKLKEISYLHAEGYAGGELKHGPIAIIDQNVILIAIIHDDELAEKTISNMLEVKARDAFIMAVSNIDKNLFGDNLNILIEFPKCDPSLSPFLTIIPLQLFAYYMADQLDLDIDKPRNLAKSVTVE